MVEFKTTPSFLDYTQIKKVIPECFRHLSSKHKFKRESKPKLHEMSKDKGSRWLQGQRYLQLLNDSNFFFDKKFNNFFLYVLCIRV